MELGAVLTNLNVFQKDERDKWVNDYEAGAAGTAGAPGGRSESGTRRNNVKTVDNMRIPWLQNTLNPLEILKFHAKLHL